MIRLDGKTGQVDGGEAQVASAGDNFPVRVIIIADDTGAAAHVCHLGVVVTGLVVLQVEGRINKGEVGEQPLCGYPARQLQQIVVGILRVVVDPLLDLEDVNRENRGLPVTQTCFIGKQHVLDDHSALRGGIRTVVDGAERGLCAGTAVHGIQVVDQCLHGLIGGPVGFLVSSLYRKVLDLSGQLLAAAYSGQTGQLSLPVAIIICQNRVQPLLFQHIGCQLLSQLVAVVQILVALHSQAAGNVLDISCPVGLLDALRHGVIKVGYALAPVLVVLVGLDGDACQRRIAGNIIGLPQVAVTGGKAVLEQLDEINLTAGGGQGQKVQIVNVDVTVDVRLGLLGLQHIHFVEFLCRNGAILQHGTHGGVAVDVGVLPLDVTVLCRVEGQLVEDGHQIGFHLPGTGALIPVQDVCLCSGSMSLFDQGLFHQILHLFHCGNLARIFLFNQSADLGRNLHCLVEIGTAHGLGSLKNGICDFLHVERNLPSIPLDDVNQHIPSPSMYFD